MLGLETIVSVGKQATFADPTTLARQSLQLYSISGGQTEADTDDEILGGGLQNSSDPVAPAPGLDDHKITVKGPLCINQFAWWNAAFFGDETPSGSASDYTHLWKTGQALPIIFLEHQVKSGLLRRHHGLVGESVTVDLDTEREGFGQFEMTFVGLKETRANEPLTGAVTAAPALLRPAQKLINILYNAVAGGDLMGGKFTYTRKLKRLRSADGTGLPYAVVLDGISTLTGSVRTRFENDNFVDDAVAKTERALSLQLMNSATRGIKWDLPHQRLSRQPLSVDGPGGLELSFDFRAWQTTADAAMTSRVLNGSATAAFG
ncbi:phage tail tube protein [Caulobacter sp. CCNWLY153]|uniref:phage tail tube protein n=1 Tax=unclassified Caulobacter TaxID=2648921 RepID=UPI002FF273CA